MVKETLTTNPLWGGGIFQLLYPSHRGVRVNTPSNVPPPSQNVGVSLNRVESGAGSGPGEGHGELIIVVTDAGAGQSSSLP